jgi:hypothetical protein
MKHRVASLLFAALIPLSGCATMPAFLGGSPSPLAGDAGLPDAAPVAVQTLDPTPPPPPPRSATTAAEFDTTTAEDRAAATSVAPAPAAEAALGTTLATLGSPADPGIWIKTPLVTKLTMGRVVYQGTSINIELRPSGGAAGSGSQISLPAMRLLGAPLTGIVEVSVFSGGAA